MFGRKKDKESKDAKDEKKKKGGSQTDAAVSGPNIQTCPLSVLGGALSLPCVELEVKLPVSVADAAQCAASS